MKSRRKQRRKYREAKTKLEGELWESPGISEQRVPLQLFK